MFLHTGTTWFAEKLGRWANHAPLTDIEGLYAAIPDVCRSIAALKDAEFDDAQATWENRNDVGIVIGWSERQKRCVGFRFDVDGHDVKIEWLKPGYIWQPGFPDEDQVPPAAKVPDILIKVADAVAPIANAQSGWSGIGGELMHVIVQRSGIRISPVKPLYNYAEIKSTLESNPERYFDICEQNLYY